MEQTCNPRRRVGSFTLGLSLILAGLVMLLYYFWPAFDFVAAARLAPLILVVLGAEVLFFAARPGQRRYDFLSVFNLRSLKSRPTKDLIWSYYFTAQGEGNIHTEAGREMLSELGNCCRDLKVLGSFEREINL